jgi:hypothetical protein
MYPSNFNDCLTTETAVNEVPFNIVNRRDGRRTTYLIGDKGYISARVKHALARHNIKLLTPYRKNQLLCAFNVSQKNKDWLPGVFKVIG